MDSLLYRLEVRDTCPESGKDAGVDSVPTHEGFAYAGATETAF
jgi:hypothetical protein